ncbi:MAG: response regulator transcription factor [Pseudomonadota bacterium]
MIRTILLYALLLALATFALEWLEYRYMARVFPREVYIVVIAVAFAALGVWVGIRLTTRRAPGAGDFERNDAALSSLGITEREYAVLQLLADGLSNKEIARQLTLSPNTVKTHVARLYTKLEVGRRTQAVSKARTLALIR